MKYCQGTKCHTYRTKDRIRGSKGDKHYQTRKQTYYHDEFCSQRCQYDWFNKFGKLAVDHFGRTYEPKKVSCDQAWYKDCRWNRNNTVGRSNYDHYFVNDLLGERRPITEQEYNNKELTQPS